MTPKGQMSGNGSGPAIAHLPPHFKAMFEPRPPIDYKANLVKRKMPPLSGCAQFVDQFETELAPERIVFETPKQRQERKRNEKMESEKTKVAEEIAKCTFVNSNQRINNVSIFRGSSWRERRQHH
jgi:U1 small nuclear ribonucleoprotein